MEVEITSLKIKIFIWLVLKAVILMKDNIVKSNPRADENCCFVTEEETVQYLLFDFPLPHFFLEHV